ncbi:MAG: hypothetical protein V1802_01580 [Candidatus Aenigmatarchaeota archaeon]
MENPGAAISCMFVTIDKGMSSEKMEKVLEYLPEPSSVEVSLYGNFDYSDIFRQTGKIVPDIKLQPIPAPNSKITFKLENSSKEKILEIYKKSIEPVTTANFRRIQFDKAEWSPGGYGEITLTPYGVHVSAGYEPVPSYISQMGKELAGTGVRITIEKRKKLESFRRFK